MLLNVDTFGIVFNVDIERVDIECTYICDVIIFVWFDVSGLHPLYPVEKRSSLGEVQFVPLWVGLHDTKIDTNEVEDHNVVEPCTKRIKTLKSLKNTKRI